MISIIILSLDQERHKQEFIQKAKAADFVISEVSRIINECNEVFAKPNHEITIRNDELKANLSKLDQLSIKFGKMLQLIPAEYNNRQAIIDETKRRHDDVIARKCIYEAELKLQVQKRELVKEKSFQVSA